MAQYKVPQNVEADDKLLGPFSFRQFIYLLVAAGGIALAVALFQIFPLLAVIPLPVVFFFAILALPLKKDQPMETYLAALVSFYTKPRKRFWMPGQTGTTITILAPKKVEAARTRDITQEEAGHRLSFLADVIDSGGRSIDSPIRDDVRAEANMVPDMLDAANSYNIDQQLQRATDQNHANALSQMKAAIQANETPTPTSPHNIASATPGITPAVFATNNVTTSVTAATPIATPTVTPAVTTTPTATTLQTPPSTPTQVAAKLEPQLETLSKNSDFSISTLQKEADRRHKKEKEGVYVALH